MKFFLYEFDGQPCVHFVPENDTEKELEVRYQPEEGESGEDFFDRVEKEAKEQFFLEDVEFENKRQVVPTRKEFADLREHAKAHIGKVIEFVPRGEFDEILGEVVGVTSNKITRSINLKLIAEGVPMQVSFNHSDWKVDKEATEANLDRLEEEKEIERQIRELKGTKNEEDKRKVAEKKKEARAQAAKEYEKAKKEKLKAKLAELQKLKKAKGIK